MRVVFTEIAQETYEEILEFLSRRWTEKEMQTFENDIYTVVSNLKLGNINQYQISEFGARSALIGKRHVIMYFEQVSADFIFVVLFFETRDNPNKVRKLLRKY